ncbi:MAG: SEC-C domain-containing protein, partial [Acidobacteriaceae bacterium]|nr:SEC-C domain-containing protein [Acidobacteriaceae bacterium]
KDHLRRQGKDPDAMQISAMGTPEREEWDAVLAQFKAATDPEHDEVVALGGLHILGTERHEARRIDNQLRGRAGRQGDPGSSRFYLSLQDDLLRIFGGERMQNLMLRLGMEEDVPIESRMISKRIQAAQQAVEAQHFASRKHVLEYDDVMNKQRQAVYGMRRQLLEGENQKERILDIVRGIIAGFIDQFCGEGMRYDQYDLNGLQTAVLNQFGAKLDVDELKAISGREIEQKVEDLVTARYEEKEQMIGADNLRQAERIIMLNVVDNQWKDHLLSMDHLREGIGLRGYGQKDPLIEYKKESFTMFQDMMDRIEDETVRFLYFMRIETGMPPLPYPEPEELEAEAFDGNGIPIDRGAPAQIEAQNREAQQSVLDLTRNIQRRKDKELAELQFSGGEAASKPQTVSKAPKVGRNELCPCGSGKKYKKCHGAAA